MIIRFYTVVFILFLVGLSSFVNAQQVFKATPKSVIPYLEYVPQDYTSNSDKYPVVFFLHGIGERCANTTDLATLQAGIWTVAKNGPPKLVKYGQQFPFILISIQLKNNYSTWPTWYVLEVIDHVKTYLRIDERQMHMTGLSMGGGGTWTMAEYYPQLFATASPICGGYNSVPKACAIANENLPIWAFHGDADTTVPLSRTANMVNAINACLPTPNPKAKLTIYPGVKHNSWDRAYTANHTYHNPNLYEWMLSYKNVAKGTNKIPVTYAGADKSITGNSVVINATATDSDGTIASYSWKQIDGTACTITNGSMASVSLSNLAPGKSVFKVTATDNGGATDTDYVQVTVGGTAPVANAGADATLTLPTSSISITGTGTDADGTISSYHWTFVSGPKTPVLTNATAAKVTSSDMTVAGNYVLKLEVKDDKGNAGSDQVTVSVNSSTTTNVAPIANAGPDATLTLPTSSISITGTGTDSDGTISSYNWTFVSGPKTPVLTNATAARVTSSDMTVAGNYVLKLEVKDNQGNSGSDQVTVSVISSTTTTTNVAPVANAGPNRTVYHPTTALVVAGSGSDADGTIVAYKWSQVSGPKASTLTNADQPTVSVSGLTIPGSYILQLKVTDDKGVTALDKMLINVYGESL